MSETESEIQSSQTSLLDDAASSVKLTGMNIEKFLSGHIQNPCDTQQNMVAREDKNLPPESELNQEVKNSKW